MMAGREEAINPLLCLLRLWQNRRVPTAWIALGSNLGDRAGTLRAAFEALRSLPGISGARLSPMYETEPVGPPQPAYLNACARLEVEDADPRRFLEALLAMERSFGRVRGEPWGPRTLDLDLLLFDQMILDEPDLILPHPRIQERSFVLKPLADLDPGLRHPVNGRTVEEMLAAVEVPRG